MVITLELCNAHNKPSADSISSPHVTPLCHQPTSSSSSSSIAPLWTTFCVFGWFIQSPPPHIIPETRVLYMLANRGRFSSFMTRFTIADEGDIYTYIVLFSIFFLLYIYRIEDVYISPPSSTYFLLFRIRQATKYTKLHIIYIILCSVLYYYIYLVNRMTIGLASTHWFNKTSKICFCIYNIEPQHNIGLINHSYITLYYYTIMAEWLFP